MCSQWSQCHLSSALFPYCFEILSFFLFSLSVSLICLPLFLLAYFLVEEWLIVNKKMISKRKVYKENKHNAVSAVAGELLKMSGHAGFPWSSDSASGLSSRQGSGRAHAWWKRLSRGGGVRKEGWAPQLQEGREPRESNEGVGAACPEAGSCFAGFVGQAEQRGLTVTEGSYSRSGLNDSDYLGWVFLTFLLQKENSESIDNIYQINRFTSKEGRFFRIM